MNKILLPAPGGTRRPFKSANCFLAESDPDAKGYAAARVRALFDAMAPTYGISAWLSGGLLLRWRSQLAASLRRPAPGRPIPVIVDLMAGGADLWPALRRHFGNDLRLTAVDFSAAMLARAVCHEAGPFLTLHPADALKTGLPAASATVVTCAFGLKTLAPTAYATLAGEAARLLQPGGQLALVELCLAAQSWRRKLVLAHLAGLLPLLKWLCPATAVHAELAYYARLGVDLPALRHALRAVGFTELRQRLLWPGCAVLLTAEMPGVA